MTTSPDHELRILVLDTAGIGPVVDGLGDAIARHTAGRAPADVEIVPSPPAAQLATYIAGRADLTDSTVVVAGVGAGMTGAAEHAGAGRALRQGFVAAMVEAIAAVKERGGRLLLVNGSSVVPSLPRADARRVSLDIARLNLAAFDLSIETGMSIIDADRTIAELGGDEHVLGTLTYDDLACAAIREELVRVLEDYGFFDERPLLEQVGRAIR